MRLKDANIINIDKFTGIDQSQDQSYLPLNCAFMAENMDTENGNLAVAKGCVKYIQDIVPCGEDIPSRLMRFKQQDGSFIVVVAAGKSLYAHTKNEDDTKSWKTIKTFDEIKNNRWDYVEAKITDKDTLIIANGEYPPIKYDDTGASDLGTKLPKVNFLALNQDRLFASGNADNPNMVYFSKAYALGDWSLNTSVPAAGGGEIKVGVTTGEAITGLRTIFNSVVVFKREIAYRIAGSDPLSFVIRPVPGDVEGIAHTAYIAFQDVGFFMTNMGIKTYDTISINLDKNSPKVEKLVLNSDTSKTKTAKTENIIYFTLTLKGGKEALLAYNVREAKFMIRTGLSIIDMFADNDRLYVIGEDKYVYEFNQGDSYDGRPINAYWQCPITDFQDKHTVKTMVNLYANAQGVTGSKLCIDAASDRGKYTTNRLLDEKTKYIRPPLRVYGRKIGLKLYNQSGLWWKLFSGIELEIEGDED